MQEIYVPETVYGPKGLVFYPSIMTAMRTTRCENCNTKADRFTEGLCTPCAEKFRDEFRKGIPAYVTELSEKMNRIKNFQLAAPRIFKYKSAIEAALFVMEDDSLLAAIVAERWMRAARAIEG